MPLWEALVDHARRHNLLLSAAAEAFVPYVGCLTDRDAASASLTGAAELSGARLELAYPSLHSACCGALGGTYRGESAGTNACSTSPPSAARPSSPLPAVPRQPALGGPPPAPARTSPLLAEFFRAAAPTPEEPNG